MIIRIHIKGETFSWNTNQVIYINNTVFYFEQHLQIAFSIKSKWTIENGHLWPKNLVIQVIFIFSKFVVMGIKRSVLKSLIQRSKRFVKIFKNMRYRRNKVEKIREITKSPFSLVFQLHLFFEIFFPLNLAWKDDLLMTIST